MLAILKREIKNYLKQPLFWLGVVIVIYGIYSDTGPYLTTHYVTLGEELANEDPQYAYSAEVYEGYVPSAPQEQRKIWNKQITEALISDFEMSDSKAQEVIARLDRMEIADACAYLEREYDYHGAVYLYEDSAYHKGTAEEINGYLDKVLKDRSFSFYYSRKFADFAGLYMGFFAAILLSVLYLQDTRKHTYELLHTKPITAKQYILGKVGAGFGVCVIVLTILNLLFWGLCIVYTRDSGFEVSLWDFLVSTALYILPNMLMIVCVYTLISLVFQTPLPGVPLLILYLLYSNLGGRNAEGVFGYVSRPLAIMVRFPGQLFDTALPPMALFNQGCLIVASVFIILISGMIWKRRRI